MLVTVRRKLFIKICEIYFAEDFIEVAPDADIVIYIQLSKYIEGCKEFHTLCIDLKKQEEEIFAGFSVNNKDKIKRGMKKVDCCINAAPTNEDIYEFSEFYNWFAADKGISKCNHMKLKVLRDKNALVFATACDKERIPLCRHAYIADGQRARCLYSSSHFRSPSEEHRKNLIGYANRYLHWMGMKYFKEQGYGIYDFGGLNPDKNNKTMKSINDFKMSFGGKVVNEYRLYRPLSMIGCLILKIMRLLFPGRQL